MVMKEGVNTLITAITSVIVTLCGAGGIFVFLNNKQKNDIDDRSSSVGEWQTLYNEMKDRLDEQEKQNKELQKEISQLRQTISELQIELNSYKKYENYIYDLEGYNKTLLDVIKPLVKDDVYNNLVVKKPIRHINDVDSEGGKKK